MPKVVKINDFSSSDTTENTYGKFEKVYFKKLLTLEDVNKNGSIKLEYDINNKPYLEISSKDESTIITSNSINVDVVKTEHLILSNQDLEETLTNLLMKIETLEERVKDLEGIEKVVTYDIEEDPEDELYLVELNNANIGMFGIFTLKDNCKYLYICYKLDKNISYWKKIFKY